MNILVTGGTSGLGEAIVKQLAANSGNTVYFTYASSAEKAGAMETELPNTKRIRCDFTEPASIEELLGRIAGMDLDVLVNNARGKIYQGHFYKTDADVFRNSFEQNIVTTLRITQEAIKLFRKKKFGKIINIITSYAVNKPPTGYSEYVAGKAYLMSMSRSWANEGIKFNITSNSISPSFVLTGINADTDERVIEQMVQAHPLGKLLLPEEVANAVKFFTEASQQINGTNLVINAGADML